MFIPVFLVSAFALGFAALTESVDEEPKEVFRELRFAISFCLAGALMIMIWQGMDYSDWRFWIVYWSAMAQAAVLLVYALRLAAIQRRMGASGEHQWTDLQRNFSQLALITTTTLLFSALGYRAVGGAESHLHQYELAIGAHLLWASSMVFWVGFLWRRIGFTDASNAPVVPVRAGGAGSATPGTR
jgi:hypothetical protein